MQQFTQAALNKICYSYLQRGLFLKIFILLLLQKETMLPNNIHSISCSKLYSKWFAYSVPDEFTQICLPRFGLTIEPCTAFYPGNALHSSPEPGAATGVATGVAASLTRGALQVS